MKRIRADELPLTLPRGPHRLAAVHHRANRARAIVVLAHGFTGSKTEHGRLFVDAARSLARGGIAALRFDFMGSGDSSGAFAAMTPNTEIADLQAVLDWAERRYPRIGVLGLSLGGGVSICALAARPRRKVRALCTWSTIPDFQTWRAEPGDELLRPGNIHRVGRRFFTDRPRRDVPASYQALHLPKLQIQGDADLPGFRERFAAFHATAPEPKQHRVLPGADHVFTRASDRAQIIRETTAFFRRHLGGKPS